jgi:hypothetical protein
MKIICRTLCAILGLMVLAFLAPNSARAAEGSFDRTLKVTGPVELDVMTGAGDVRVRPGNASEVEVHGIIKIHTVLGFDSSDAREKARRLEANPPILQDGNFIRIGRIEDRELRKNVSISYMLTVPTQTGIKCVTGSGNFQVDGIHGPARATTGSGNIWVSNLGDEVEAITGAGGITLNRVQGAVRASTGSGNIQANEIAGDFHLSTGSGGIRLSEISSANGKVSTGSGNVEVTGVRGALRVMAGSGSIHAQGAPAGDWTLRTGSGSVSIQTNRGASFRLDAHTDSGQIETHRSVTLQGTVARGTLHGQVGQGGPLVSLRTGSGNIRIE